MLARHRPWPPPGSQSVAIGESGMQHRHRHAKASLKPLQQLRRQADFRHQHQALLTRRALRFNAVQVDLGLAAAGDALQQERCVSVGRLDVGHRRCLCRSQCRSWLRISGFWCGGDGFGPRLSARFSSSAAMASRQLRALMSNPPASATPAARRMRPGCGPVAVRGASVLQARSRGPAVSAQRGSGARSPPCRKAAGNAAAQTSPIGYW